MVHRGDTSNFLPESEKPWLKTMTVKAEIGDLFEEQTLLSSKRPKLDFSYKNNPLEQPRPLGLKLKKSPSFLDLIQMRLSQEKSVSLAKSLPRREKEHKNSGIGDKLKASNFPATILKIGTWEYKSRYEGDLVAKCYFAKHKLVWEVLDGGLKNKIEIQWSDIVAIKGNYPDDGPGTLDVVLARHPLFFREINPQPRKHTLWQATSDFTGEQATVYRRHFLQCSPGLLGKHFEKLIQCDPRLNFLSQQPEIVLDNLYFEHRAATFCDPNESERVFNLKTESDSIIFGLGDTPSASGACLSSSEIENSELVSTSAEHNSLGKTSTSLEICVLDGNAKRTKDANGVRLMDQIKLPRLRASMSMSDLVNHIGQCISEQMTSSNPNLSIDDDQRSNIFEEIAHYLFSDSQTSVSDEKSIMSKVNSLCCLLQTDPISAIQNCQVKSNDASDFPGAETTGGIKPLAALLGSNVAELVPTEEDESRNGNGCKKDSSMTREDSVGELLLDLPRIASMPQFLSNMSEDSINLAR